MKKKQNIKIAFFLTFFFVFLLFIIYYLLPKSVHSATVTTQATVGSPAPTVKKSPTPSAASPSATPTDEKVQEIRDAVKEKVQEKIQEIKNKIENKGYVGILKEMTDSTLTLETLAGEKLVSLDKGVKIIASNKKEIKSKDLEIDQKIICMGTLDENKILVAKRIVVTPLLAKPLPKRESFIGRVSSLDLKAKTISLNHLRKLNQQYLVKVDKNTKFSKGKFEDLGVDQILVIVSSVVKESETPVALLINPLE